jgi:hypothetical protein
VTWKITYNINAIGNNIHKNIKLPIAPNSDGIVPLKLGFSNIESSLRLKRPNSD